MLQPLWMWKSALTLMIFAFGASGPKALRRPPARSTQSSARITSAALIASIASGTMAFERGAVVPALNAARHPPHEDDGVLGALEDARRLLDELGRRRGIGRRHEARGVDRRERLRQLRLLHLGVEIDVDRAPGRRVGDPSGADERLARGSGGGGLIVPLGVVAHDRALVARGMNPVDPRPALGGIDRTRCAQHDHRLAV